MKNENRHLKISLAFIACGLLALTGAAILGSLAAFQFAVPGILDHLSFVKSRPLHVGLAVSWIFLSAIGGIYYYLPRFHTFKWRFSNWPLVQLILILVTGTAILFCYARGIFGGREYWEHPPWFAIPIVISWLLLAINFFKSIFTAESRWPVYTWMWATGILFFLLTFLESNLWIFPYFRDHLARDLTVQWKSYGALVGSWNMLVYGTAAFLAEKLSGENKAAQSRTAFLLYILGFSNLLFGWAHHTYTVPSASWVRNVSYITSMSELLILAKLLYGVRKSVQNALPHFGELPGRFLFASDVWILLNLVVALAISIPAVNLYTHGTHITVAHAMGSAIGINTMILLASCLFIAHDALPEKFSAREKKIISAGLVILNLFLLAFWFGLLWAGAIKGLRLVQNPGSFHSIMQDLQPAFVFIAVIGTGMLLGICMITIPVLYRLAQAVLTKSRSGVCAGSLFQKTV